MSQSRQIRRIVLTGGGSGGHTFPLIAVARELKRIALNQQEDLELYYIGPNDFTAEFVRKEGIPVRTIAGGKFRRGEGLQGFLKNLWDIFKVIQGLLQAYYHLLIIMPDCIFSKGGYGAFPVLFWGTIFAIPVYIHESDAVPGLVNKLFAKFAKAIFVSFPVSKSYFPQWKTAVTGNPVRRSLFKNTLDGIKVKKLLGLDQTRPLILILGGSQGAQHINTLILDILPEIIDKTEIVHQTGKTNYRQVVREAKIVFQEFIRSEEKEKYYHPLPFLEETEQPVLNSLGLLYAAADLIIARAGSGLIFEIAAAGKASIIIPLPWASQGHQRKNAYEYQKSGACVVIEEKNLRPNIFTNLILRLLNDKKKRKSMEEAAGKFARPAAAYEIAEYLLKQI